MGEMAASSHLTRAIRELVATDQSVYRAIAETPSPTLDTDLRRLSRSADHSGLWISIAVALATVPGRSRRAAVAGAGSIAVASTVTNLFLKLLVNRRRPGDLEAEVPLTRRLPLPHSPSFPSGHTASGFAFASTVGAELPWLSLPLNVLAAMVAYSRVHTGVHYPLDTFAGAIIGVATGSGTAAIARRFRVPLAKTQTPDLG